MPVYRCPIHGRWVDSERESGCPDCLAAGGKDEKAARKRNRNPPVSARRTGDTKKKRGKLLLYVFMLALGASALALPQVQELLRDQGLGEVADRAQRMSSEVEGVASRVEDGARTAADKLDALSGDGDTDRATQYGLPAETVKLSTTHGGGGSGLVYLPPRNAREPRPLLVWLHPSGTPPRAGLKAIEAEAGRWRFAVLGPRAHAKETPWDVGDGTALSPDEQHVLDCMQELYDDPRLTVDARRVLIVGASRGAQAALRLATHKARFSHAAALGGTLEVRGLGPLKPPLYVAVGGGDPQRAERAYEQLRGLGYPVQKVGAPGGPQDEAEALVAIVQRWLGS